MKREGPSSTQSKIRLRILRRIEEKKFSRSICS